MKSMSIVAPFSLLVLLASSAQAQIMDVKRSAVADISRLTFGYLCADTFILRNDGDKAVEAILAVSKSREQSPMTLAAREQIQFTSQSKEDVELWIDDKLVARAEKEKRQCKDVQGNASVAVAPLEVTTDDDRGRRNVTNWPYFNPWLMSAFGPWGGFGGPWGAYGGPWGGFGYRPFYVSYVGVPIVVGNGSRGTARRR